MPNPNKYERDARAIMFPNLRGRAPADVQKLIEEGGRLLEQGKPESDVKALTNKAGKGVTEPITSPRPSAGGKARPPYSSAPSASAANTKAPIMSLPTGFRRSSQPIVTQPDDNNAMVIHQSQMTSPMMELMVEQQKLANQEKAVKNKQLYVEVREKEEPLNEKEHNRMLEKLKAITEAKKHNVSDEVLVALVSSKDPISSLPGPSGSQQIDIGDGKATEETPSVMPKGNTAGINNDAGNTPGGKGIKRKAAQLGATLADSPSRTRSQQRGAVHVEEPSDNSQDDASGSSGRIYDISPGHTPFLPSAYKTMKAANSAIRRSILASDAHEYDVWHDDNCGMWAAMVVAGQEKEMEDRNMEAMMDAREASAQYMEDGKRPDPEVVAKLREEGEV